MLLRPFENVSLWQSLTIYELGWPIKVSFHLKTHMQVPLLTYFETEAFCWRKLFHRQFEVTDQICTDRFEMWSSDLMDTFLFLKMLFKPRSSQKLFLCRRLINSVAQGVKWDTVVSAVVTSFLPDSFMFFVKLKTYISLQHPLLVKLTLLGFFSTKSDG